MKELFKSLAAFQQECPVIHKGVKHLDVTKILPTIVYGNMEINSGIRGLL